MTGKYYEQMQCQGGFPRDNTLPSEHWHRGYLGIELTSRLGKLKELG
jgi:hypothetical protein